MKFRKKPVVIEATQWFKNGDHPAVYTKRDSASDLWGYIKTLEGEHIVTPGDWIITGVKGEYYPCKPDIFEMTYEPADSVKQPAQQPAQQPICGLDVYLDPNDGLKPKLFPKKPAQPSKPLTDEQIKLIMDGRGEEGDDDYVKPAFDPFGISEDDLMNFARAIEAAHGIKE